MGRYVLLLVSLAVLVGCSTYAADRYSISADNVTALRNLNGKQLNVGPFSSSEPGLTEILCRGLAPIKTPDGETFAEFIRESLIDELKIANVYSPTARVILTGHLNDIDFSSADGAWNLSLIVKSSNGASMTVTESYAFTSSYVGDVACAQTAQALMPAVQNLIGKVINSPEFSTLLN